MDFFGTAGIRGSIKTKVTPELALKVGKALGTYISGEERPRVVVGMDARTSGDMIKSSLKSGIMHSGSDVRDVDIATTPAVAFFTERIGDAGVMITASHNPPTDNGIKLFNSDGSEFFMDQEERIEEIIKNEDYKEVDWRNVGSKKHIKVGDLYLDHINRYVDHDTDKKILLDCASGPGSLVTPYVLRDMGCEVVSMNSHLDGYFPGRKPEPRPENIKHMSPIVRDINADLGIAHDGDADRIAIVDENGEIVTEDTLIALLGGYYVEENNGGTVITSINTSFRIDEYIQDKGGRVERHELGKLHQKLKKPDVVFAAEPWKFIHPEFGPWIDSAISAGMLLKMIDKEEKTMSELAAEVNDYPIKKENIRCKDGNKEKTISEAEKVLRKEFEDQIKDEITVSGIRLNLEDGSWILVRASGTEPKIRVFVEGKDEERLNQLYEKTHNIVKEIAKDKNGG